MNFIQKDFPVSRITLYTDKHFFLANIPVGIIVYLLAMAASVPQYSKTSWLQIITGSMLSGSFFLLLKLNNMNSLPAQRRASHGIKNQTVLKAMVLTCVLIQLGGMYLLAPCLRAMFKTWVLLMFWFILINNGLLTSSWLKKHSFLYAVLRALVMPFIIWWLCALSATKITLNIKIQLLMVFSFTVALCFELYCKYKDEKPTPSDAEIIMLAPLVAMTFIQSILFTTIRGNVPAWYSITNLIFYIVTARKVLHPALVCHQQSDKNLLRLSTTIGYLFCTCAIFFQ